MALDYNKCIAEAALEANTIFGLEYNDSEKRFSFKYPSNDYLKITLKVTSDTAKSLGFGDVERISERSVSKPIVSDFDVSGNEDKARSLVYDTGMVILTLDHMSSISSSGLQDKFMGSLYPTLPGALVFNPIKAPEVSLPYHTSRLHFSLFRFTEKSEPSPLGWNAGAYLYGHLIGKV